MKIRLAKKIMRHNTPYWIFRYLCYNRIMLPGVGYKVDFKDHRIHQGDKFNETTGMLVGILTN